MKTTAKTVGLRYWMLRVLDECDKAAVDFSADPVHDLRVALRRCRSMADGLMALDPDPEWKAMKKAGKRLFQNLGALRDVQIMMEWTDKLLPRAGAKGTDLEPLATANHVPDQQAHALASPDESADPAARALLQVLAAREHEHKREAQVALEAFDRKQWRSWAHSLPARAARFRLGSALFKHLALERWIAARALHARAMRNRSQTALHQLRIGIKRFRYIVENFLPEQHKEWSDDLKHLQDLLGEVHDLDVLWATAVSSHIFPDAASRQRWHELIVEERSKRVNQYRERATGPGNLWQVWREELPPESQIAALSLRRMRLWASVLDPDFAHSERVTQLALELYDGLTRAGLLAIANGADARSSLRMAALLHDVGKSTRKKGHQKASQRLIQKHDTPLGWKPEDVLRAATVARFHRGALPRKTHRLLRDLLPAEQKVAIQLASILRLANAFDTDHKGRIRRLRIAKLPSDAPSPHRNGARGNGLSRRWMGFGRYEPLLIEAEGYAAHSKSARVIAAERHLLETVLQRAVVVRTMQGREPQRPALKPHRNRLNNPRR